MNVYRDTCVFGGFPVALKIKSILCLGFVLMSAGFVLAQMPGPGEPDIKNYAPGVYGAHPQNWAVVQDHRGLIYVGNTSGLLEYDGSSWRNLVASQGLIVRSLACDSTGRIYVGARSNLGYLKPDSMGTLRFQSMKSLLPDSLSQLGDVWCTIATPGGIFFQTSKYILRWRKAHFRIWRASGNYHTPGYVNGHLYVRVTGKGLMKLTGNKWTLPASLSYFKDKRVYAVLSYDSDHILIGTSDDGLWLYDGKKLTPFATEARQWLINHQLYCATRLDNDHFALGTRSGGVLILSHNGSVVQVINEQSGLQDQSVWYEYVDREGSLWLALNDGISRIDWSLPFRSFDKKNGLEGAILSIKRFKSRLYVATTVGVYYSIRKNNPQTRMAVTRFHLVRNLQTQAFGLGVSGNELLAATVTGVYVTRDTVASLLKSQWMRASALFVSRDDPDSVWVGLDNGLALLLRDRGQWHDRGKIKGISGFVHTIVQAPDHSLWVGTVLNGLYHLDTKTESAVHYGPSKGVAGGEIDVFLRDRQILAGTDNGLRRYDAQKNRFVHEDFGLPFLKDSTQFVPQFTVGSDHSIWVVVGKGDHDQNYHLHHLLAVPGSDSLAADHTPDILRFNGSVYTIYQDPISNDYWFGDGVVLVKWHKKVAPVKPYQPSIILRKVVTVPDDSLLFGGYESEASVITLPYRDRNIRVTMSLPAFIYSGKHEYQYRLNGFSLGWSQWSNEPFAVFTNLPAGRYTLNAKVRDATGPVSKATILRLTILPPWYETAWAYMIYGILGIVMVGGMVTETSRIKHQRLQKKLQREEERNRLMTAELQVRKSEMEKEQIRQRISWDLHDEIGSNLSSIALLSGLMEQKDLVDPEIQDRIMRIRSLAETSAQSMRDIVWLVNPRNDSMPQLVEHVRDTALQQLDGISVHFNADPSSFKGDYSLDFRRNIFLIIKESLQNIIRHSGADEVVIAISEKDGKFNLEITDNGKGFDEQSNKRGNGLDNIERRAKMIGGKITIASKQAEGTHIQAEVKIP